jgi:hypothetical protein
MKNWKTTAIGGLGALMIIIPETIKALEGQTVDWKVVALSAIMALVGYFAKDKNVTGGKTQQ